MNTRNQEQQNRHPFIPQQENKMELKKQQQTIVPQADRTTSEKDLRSENYRGVRFI